MIKVTSTRQAMEEVYQFAENEYKNNENYFLYCGLVDIRMSLGMSKTVNEAHDYFKKLKQQ